MPDKNKVKDLNKRIDNTIKQLQKVERSQSKIAKELPKLLKRLPFEKGGAVAAKPKANGFLPMNKRILQKYDEQRAKKRKKK